MADQKLNINIGSSWNGAGTSKAMGALNQISRTAGKTASAVGSISSAFGSVGGEASKAVGAISRFAGAFASGGPIGLGIAAVTSLVSILQELKEEEEKAAEVKFDNQIKALENINKSAVEAAASIQSISTALQQVATSFTAVQSSEAKVKSLGVQIEAEKLRQKGDSVGAAKLDAKSVAIEQNSKVDEAVTTFKNAKNTYNTQYKVLETYTNNVERLSKQVDELRTQYDKQLEVVNSFTASESDVEELTRIRKRMGSAERELMEAEKLQSDQSTKVTNLWNARVKAEKDLEVVKKQAELANTQANTKIVDAEKKEAEKKAADAKKAADEQKKRDEEEEKAREEGVKATLEAITAEKERNDKMRDEARSEKKLKEAIDKDKELQDNLKKATQELADAQLDYANKLRNAQVASANATWQGWSGNNGIPADQIAGNGINGQNRYTPRNNATLNDAAYNQRVAEGMERNAQSQGYGLSARDKARERELQAKHDRLQDRGQELSDRDAAELAELEARDPSKQKAKAAKEAADAAKELEAAKERKDQAEQNMWANVEEIKTMMQKLGLK